MQLRGEQPFPGSQVSPCSQFAFLRHHDKPAGALPAAHGRHAAFQEAATPAARGAGACGGPGSLGGSRARAQPGPAAIGRAGAVAGRGGQQRVLRGGHAGQTGARALLHLATLPLAGLRGGLSPEAAQQHGAAGQVPLPQGQPLEAPLPSGASGF